MDGVTEILCSFRLVLEEIIAQEILESIILGFPEKFLTILLYQTQKTTSPGYSGFTFVDNTISNSPKVSRVRFLRSDRLFSFISICKFGSFKNLFAMVTSLSELYFRFRRIIQLVQKKKVTSNELWQLHKQLEMMEMSEA